LPFANREPTGDREAVPRQFDFIYVSDGLPHKNHHALFAAWTLLSEEGIRPTLAITLSLNDRDALDALEAAQQKGVSSISNLGRLGRVEIDAAYRQSGALIFPSLTESFGLPLIEARERHLPILAGELDYVRDVCVPVESFDPRSPRSIARAVKRHLGYSSQPLDPMSATRFWTEFDMLLKS
jgi:glycosyltransferase involved in cell wall biosynthesis